MIKVYVAGALNADAVGYIKNVHKMIHWANEVRKRGFSVYVPCLDFLMGMQIGDFEYKDYFDNSQPWLESSDALFVVPGWGNSEGTKKEIKRAKELNIPVYYNYKELLDNETSSTSYHATPTYQLHSPSTSHKPLDKPFYKKFIKKKEKTY